MIKKGKPVNAGDHIPYVICKGQSKTAAERARHPDQITRAKATSAAEGKEAEGVEELAVDVEWYLSNQILPPISRLCAVIDGLSTGSLAEALGLDSRRFRMHDMYNQVDVASPLSWRRCRMHHPTVPRRARSQCGMYLARTHFVETLPGLPLVVVAVVAWQGGNGEDDWDFAGETQLSDADRFKDTAPLRLRCTNPKCRCAFIFTGAVPDVHATPKVDGAAVESASDAAPSKQSLKELQVHGARALRCA